MLVILHNLFPFKYSNKKYANILYCFMAFYQNAKDTDNYW